MEIGIAGFGNVGRRLATLFRDAGYLVRVGHHRRADATEAGFESGSLEEVAEASDALVLSIPYLACADVLPRLHDALVDKVVIDSTNPLKPDWSPLLLGQETSAAEEIARLVPRSHVVKAFNTVFADVMTRERLDRDGRRVTAFVCGNDHGAKERVIRLAADSGFSPLDVGALRSARYLESIAHLNIHIAVTLGGGTDAAFVYHQVRH